MRLLFRLCKFWRRCNFYAYNSFTCNRGGGPYCGQWREFSITTLPSISAAARKRTEEVAQRLHSP